RQAPEEHEPQPLGRPLRLASRGKFGYLTRLFLLRQRTRCEAACAEWTARQQSGDRDGQPAMKGRDRVGNVPLGPDWERLGVGNRWKGRCFEPLGATRS